MAVRLNQEAGGFKLLEEDAMDDRPPCAAVKKFVTSVLDRKDMKDHDVANSFRNLMEYRDWNSSPSACSVATSSSALDGDRMNSPPSPSTPPAMQASRDDRLPNELLDEICEDIGMKEDMELDFVEFLMEQDTNPHAYMTQEAISSSGAYNSAAGSTISTPTGSGSGMGSGSGSNCGSASGSHHSNIANNNNNNNTIHNNNNDGNKSFTPLGPPSNNTPNFLFKPNFTNDSDWLNQLPSPIINSSGQSSGTTTLASSENNSPAQKRLHLSASAETSPNKGRSQTPPGHNRHKMQSSSNNFAAPNSGVLPTSAHVNNVHSTFKMPQSGPLMAKRSHSYPQGVPACSPVHSTHSSGSQGSNASSCHSNYGPGGGMKPPEFSSKPSSSCPGGEMGDLGETLGNSGPHASMNNNNEMKKEPCISPIAIVPSTSCDFAKPASPADNQPMFQGMTTLVGGRDSSVFQRVEKQPPPPNVSVKTMQQQHQHQQHQQQHQQQQHQQQQRWMVPPSQHGPHMAGPQPPYFPKGGYPSAPSFPPHHRPMTHMPGGPPGTQTVRTPVESPLDQGYFSNESAGNCSNGSAPSPAFSSSMSSFSSSSTLMPADHHHLHHHPQHPHHHHHHHQHPSSQSQQSQTQAAPQPQPMGSQKSSQQQQQDNSEVNTGRPPGQKSVRFSTMPERSPPGYHQPIPVEGKGYGVTPPCSTPQSDCAFEGMDTNGQKAVQSGKILPRINHGMKSGVAPYTVPNSQGQIMGPGVPGFDFADRPSCAMSGGGGGGSGQEAPGEEMHPYMGKQVAPKVSGSGSHYMDGNQNMMRVDSVPEYPGGHPQGSHPMQQRPPGEYPMPADQQSPFSMDHFSSMQQHHQQHPSQQQQQPEPHACSESMHSQHAHMQPPNMSIPPQPPMHQGGEQQQQPHPQQFSSCSHSVQPMSSDFRPMHHSSMQISGAQNNYQMPLAMSTPMSNRPGSNPRLMSAPQMGQGFPPMCPPAYDSNFNQGQRPEVMTYPQAQQPPPPPPHPGQPMPGQSVHRGWGPGSEELHVQVPPSPMKAGMPPPHQGLPHMQPSPTPACAAPMGPSPHMQDPAMLNAGVHGMNSGGSHHHLSAHPEYGPCVGMNCEACKMGPNTVPGHPPPQLSHPHPHLGPCAGPACHTCKMQQQQQQQHHHQHQQHPQALPHVGPCAGPNCTACKLSQANRPQMLSSQQKFLQHLIMDEGNSAYRSHPLFPLLRDLVIAEANFDNPQFHYQQLLSTLPNDLQKLLQNFLHRNRPSGHYQSNQAVESVIMDGLRLAHSNLVDKIRQRQEMEKMKGGPGLRSTSLRSMEEFCQKFDHSITGPMVRGGVPNGMGTLNMAHPMGGYHHDGSYIQPGMGPMAFRPLKDGQDLLGESSLAVTSPQANKTESKKHPSLPKEAVAMMMEWLRNHKDNPYPNDDEKAMLIKQTGLSINQINYWFTNARRRILPKWAQCKT